MVIGNRMSWAVGARRGKARKPGAKRSGAPDSSRSFPRKVPGSAAYRCARGLGKSLEFLLRLRRRRVSGEETLPRRRGVFDVAEIDELLAQRPPAFRGHATEADRLRLRRVDERSLRV